MNIEVNINYNGNEYISDVIEMNEEENKKLKSIIEKAVAGDVEFFKIENGNKKYYFGKKILENSIITIITK